MRIIVIGAPVVATALAGHLTLPIVSRVDEITTDGFVLDGSALALPDARALDIVLRSRAAEVDAVLVLGRADGELVDHYLGRVIELDPADAFGSALDGLREVLLAA
jgi:hypothetical protein